MDFRGHLRLPEDAGTGIPVLLRLDDIFVVISSGSDELGTWRADDVAIERIFSNQFAIELDGESMVFLAQDALGFAYDGISAIEDLQERLTKRRVFKRSKKKPKRVETVPEGEPVADTTPEPGSAAIPAAEYQETPAAQLADESTPEPADEPVLAGEPKAIWTPPSASQPPAQPRVAPAPDFEVAVPEPIQRRVDAEPPVPLPDDVRVAYPQPSAPPPPAVESFLPPTTTPEETETAEPRPAAHTPLEVSPPSSEPPSASKPAVAEEPPPVETPAEKLESAPAAGERASGTVADEPEYEIEEVSAASTGGTWADDAMVGDEPPEFEIEIEEYVVPSAGAAEMFTAPALPDDVEPAPQETPDQLPESEPDAPEPDSTEPGVEEPVAEDAGLVEGRHLADDAEAPAAEIPAAEDPAAEVPVDQSVASNGHSKSREADAAPESNKRERRHSLFGRSRDKKVPPHEHEYGDPKTIGGLRRQVCEVCGHVTFSGEDVYQGW